MSAGDHEKGAPVPYDFPLVWTEGARAERAQGFGRSATWASFVELVTKLDVVEGLTMGEFHALSKDEKNEQKRAPWIVGGSFAGDYRDTSKLRERTLLTLDLDSLTPSGLDLLRSAEGPLSGWAHVGHATMSSTPDAPRLRLFLPLQQPLKTAEEYKHAARGFCEMLEEALREVGGVREGKGQACDPASWNAAQFMYLPRLCYDAEPVILLGEGIFPDVPALTAKGREAFAREGAEKARPKPAARAVTYEGDNIDRHWRELMEANGAVIVPSPNRKTELATKCLWHDDKNPSLEITPEGKMLCRTHGCTDNGRPLTWLRYVAKARGCSEKQAAAWARERLGLPPAGRPTVDVGREFENLDAEGWPEPQPLIQLEKAKPYPVDQFPENARDAILAHQAANKQPVSLVASTALGAMSLYCQGLANVPKAENETAGPLSLYIATIASSGERKSTAMQSFSKAAWDWQGTMLAFFEEEQKTLKSKHDAWAAERRGLEKAIEKKPDQGPKLVELDKEEPRPTQREPRLIYEDITAEALLSKLRKSHPSVALWLDEAGRLTGGQGMRKETSLNFLSLLNNMWNNGTAVVDRKQAESSFVAGARITCFFSFQPGTFEQFVSSTLVRANGGLARFLICQPESTIGTRILKGTEEEERAKKVAELKLRGFSARGRTLLETPLPLNEKNGALEPRCLTLEPPAEDVWRQYHNEVEQEMGKCGELAEFTDFGSKSAEQARRIAGVFHVWMYGTEEAGHKGGISGDTMQAATKVARWHLDEARRALRASGSQEAADAAKLESWIEDQGLDRVLMREILHGGPNVLRVKDRRDAAVRLLTDHGRARIEKPETGEVLVLNPRRHADR